MLISVFSANLYASARFSSNDTGPNAREVEEMNNSASRAKEYREASQRAKELGHNELAADLKDGSERAAQRVVNIFKGKETLEG